MQFKVPKFIEMESKIFGPLTFKQFIYLGGGAGLSYILLKLLPTIIAFPLIIFVAFFSWSLAFTRRDKYGKPFVEVTEAAFKYFTKTKLYTWKRTPKEPKEMMQDNQIQNPLLSVPKITSGKLSDKLYDLETQQNEQIANEDIDLPENK